MRNGPHPSQQRPTASCSHYVDGSTHDKIDKMLRSSIMFHHPSVRFPSFQSWSELLNSMLWLRDECLQPLQRTPRMCLTWYDTMLLTRWAVCLVLFQWLLISVAWSQRQVHANYIKYLCRILGIGTYWNHVFSKACQTSTKVIKGAQTKVFLSKKIFVALLPAIATVRTKALLLVWLLRWNLRPLRNMICGFKWRNMTIK